MVALFLAVGRCSGPDRRRLHGSDSSRRIDPKTASQSLGLVQKRGGQGTTLGPGSVAWFPWQCQAQTRELRGGKANASTAGADQKESGSRRSCEPTRRNTVSPAWTPTVECLWGRGSGCHGGIPSSHFCLFLRER